MIMDTKTVSIPKEHKVYEQIKTALKNREYNTAVKLSDKTTQIALHTKGDVVVKDGQLFIKDEKLPDCLGKRILQFIEEDLPYEPLKKFWKNLRKNPNEESKQDLYAFLEHNGIPITEDGCFIAYKAVDANFKDYHTGKFDNSVGKVIKMPRAKVDPDRNHSCSKGLHVATYNYMSGFGGKEGQHIEVKVNPKDVVAVPVDYNSEKMRVCKYEVIDVCEKKIEKLLYPASKRTYYYKKASLKNFDPKNVTSHKPKGRHSKYTVRALDRKEAVTKFKTLLKD